VNPYHGKYLHRGQSLISDSLDNIVDTVIYHERYVEQDEIWALNTVTIDAVIVRGMLRGSAGNLGNIEMRLVFNANDECIISSTGNSAFPVTGTGTFVKDGDEWGGKKRDAIYLNYSVDEGTNTHRATDTLVFRDKGISFEEFLPVVLEE
jgi:hypothetical protein